MKKSTIIILSICALSLLSFEYIMIKDFLNFLRVESTYFNQKTTNTTRGLFGPKRISTGEHQEDGIRFSSEGREFFFTETDANDSSGIMQSKHAIYLWLPPDILSLMQ